MILFSSKPLLQHQWLYYPLEAEYKRTVDGGLGWQKRGKELDRSRDHGEGKKQDVPNKSCLFPSSLNLYFQSYCSHLDSANWVLRLLQCEKWKAGKASWPQPFYYHFLKYYTAMDRQELCLKELASHLEFAFYLVNDGKLIYISRYRIKMVKVQRIVIL